MGISFKRCWVVGNCVHNAINALALRHLVQFRHPITFVPGQPYLYREEVYRQLRELFHCSYQAGSWRKNKSLERQMRIQDSLDWDEPRPDRALSHIKTQVELMVPKKGRVIQAFHVPADNYSCADEYRAFTEALTHWTSEPHIHDGMYVHVRSACGLNHTDISSQINSWLAELSATSYSIFMDDVTNMDGSIQLPHLQLQVEMYQQLNQRMAQDLEKSIRYKGMIRTRQGTVVYAARGTVRSGAQDTSSGQTSRRLDMFVRVCRSIGVRQVRAFVFGDDIIAFIVGGPTDPTVYDREHSTMGLACRACFVQDLCQADFLACAFVPDNEGGYAMVPKIGRLLAKLFWTWRDVPPRRRVSYIHQIAEAFVPRFAGCEFMITWLTWHMQLPVDKGWHHERPIQHGPHHCALQWPEFFARRYGLPLPPRELEESIRRVPQGGTAIISHPWTRFVQEYDLADPLER